MGGLFGRRRSNDNSAAIRALIASNEENHRRFLAMMEQSEKSFVGKLKEKGSIFNYKMFDNKLV